MDYEKELLTIDGIIRECKSSKKFSLYVIIFIWVVLILVGIKYKSMFGCSITAGLMSIFFIAFAIYESVREVCIKNKQLDIKDDVIFELKEVPKRDRYDYSAYLEKAGEQIINYKDYQEMKIGDGVYVFEYFNKKGKCIKKDIYQQNKYRISPELYEFYKRNGEERGDFYE